MSATCEQSTGRDEIRRTLTATYRIELRTGGNPWWLCIGSRVVSKHQSKPAARVGRKRAVDADMALLTDRAGQ